MKKEIMYNESDENLRISLPINKSLNITNGATLKSNLGKDSFTLFNENNPLIDLLASHLDRAIYSYDFLTDSAKALNPSKSQEYGLPRYIENLHKYILENTDKNEFLNNVFSSIKSKILLAKPSIGTRFYINIKNNRENRPSWFDLKASIYYDRNKKPKTAIFSLLDITSNHDRDLEYERFKKMLEENDSKSCYFIVDINTNRIDFFSGSLFIDNNLNGRDFSRVLESIFFSEIYNIENKNARDFYNIENLTRIFNNGDNAFTREWINKELKIWYSITTQLIRDPYNNHIKAFIHIENITEEKGEILNNKSLAERDGLTGLYNRTYGENTIKKILNSKDCKRCALIMVDLDNLKSINDNLGHKEGDRALRGLALALSKQFKAKDIVIRLGGDEFMVFIYDIPKSTNLRGTMKGLLNRVSELHIGENALYPVQCSIGVAFGFTGRSDFEELYRKADLALYHVKETGKNGFSIFNSQMDKNGYIHNKTQRLKLPINNSNIEVLLPLNITVNLDSKTYYKTGIDISHYSQIKSSGSYNEILDYYSNKLISEDKNSFLEFFDTNNLKRLYELGNNSVSAIFTKRSKSEPIEIYIVFVEDSIKCDLLFTAFIKSSTTFN